MWICLISSRIPQTLWASVRIRASSHTPKCFRVDSWSGHIPRLQVLSPAGEHMGGNQAMFLTHIDVSLSLSLHPLPLKSINKSSGEDFKKLSYIYSMIITKSFKNGKNYAKMLIVRANTCSALPMCPTPDWPHSVGVLGLAPCDSSVTSLILQCGKWGRVWEGAYQKTSKCPPNVKMCSTSLAFKVIQLKPTIRTPAGLAQWIEYCLRTKGSLVRFPVRAAAWVVGHVPSRGSMRGNHTLMFLSLSLSLLLSKNK